MKTAASRFAFFSSFVLAVMLPARGDAQQKPTIEQFMSATPAS